MKSVWVVQFKRHTCKHWRNKSVTFRRVDAQFEIRQLNKENEGELSAPEYRIVEFIERKPGGNMNLKTFIAAMVFVLALSTQVFAQTITPYGGYVGGGTPTITPDGGYVGGTPVITPDGGYVGGGAPTITPDGGYVGGTPTITPDGGYVGGTPTITPDGGYVGGGDY